MYTWRTHARINHNLSGNNKFTDLLNWVMKKKWFWWNASKGRVGLPSEWDEWCPFQPEEKRCRLRRRRFLSCWVLRISRISPIDCNNKTKLKKEKKWKIERNWKSWIWLIRRDEGERKKPWRGKRNWDRRSHLGVEDWWGSQVPQWSSMWSSPFFSPSLSLWYSNTFVLGVWSFGLESMDCSRQCKKIIIWS